MDGELWAWDVLWAWLVLLTEGVLGAACLRGRVRPRLEGPPGAARGGVSAEQPLAEEPTEERGELAGRVGGGVEGAEEGERLVQVWVCVVCV